MLEDIIGVLDACTEMSYNLKRESAKIMIFSKIAIIEWEIEDLTALKCNCQGCFTEHPSQDQHMSHGGVWNTSHGLNKSLSASIRRVFGVFENERMLIAKAAVKKMGLQGLFIEYFEDNIIPLPKSP